MLPKIYNNFIEDKDSDKLCKFIDDNLSFFDYSEQVPTYTLRLGKHLHFEENNNLLLTKDIKDTLIKYSEKIINSSKNSFNVEDSYISQIWLVKKMPFSYHKIHDDIGDGDSHLQFSGVAYLNDTGPDGGGEIFFPKLNYEHKPEKGDMILFESNSLLNSHGVKLVKDNRYSMAFWTTHNKNLMLKLD